MDVEAQDDGIMAKIIVRLQVKDSMRISVALLTPDRKQMEQKG
jgi:hypothetical protein